MLRLFNWNSSSPPNATLPPTKHGSQVRTEFAQYLEAMPNKTWETNFSKFVLYNGDSRPADLKQYGPPVYMRQIMFDKAKYTIDLNANDLLNGFTGLNTQDDTCAYLSVMGLHDRTKPTSE